jgi:hypothetical protein
VPPEQLYPRRLAVRALGLVLDHLNLSATAIRFNADDPEQAFPGHAEGEVRIYVDGWSRGQLPVAQVFVHGARARVVVSRLRLLVRPKHRRDFRAEDLGIVPGPDEPDVDKNVDLSDVIAEHGEAMARAPQRVLQRRRRPHAPPRYVGAGDA